MSKILAIAGRELRSYFVSPLAYVVAAFFMLVAGYLFSLILYHTKQANLQPLFSNLAVMFLLITPALTMRLLADERRTGTIELLMTSPLTDRELVLGKYLAAVTYLAFLLALTFVFPLILAVSAKPDWAPIWTGYLGTMLLGSSFMALGVLASSLTANMIIAAMITFALSLVVWLLPSAGQMFGGSANDVMTYMSVINHQENLGRGVLDTTDILFYLSFIVACLFMTVRSVETYHWR
ncbi:MAG: type transporter [Cyanobacteria bacterium RYN_339]|nr:type transporter [Cyanobacteria bacterium RYN_339]